MLGGDAAKGRAMNLGPYELNEIYCGDSAAMLAALPDACIDLTVTSPPYDDMDMDFNPIPSRGLREYNGYIWNFKWLSRQLYRVTKPGGVVVWVVNDPTINGSESLASSLQKIYFRKVGFNLHDTMIYDKGNHPCHDPRNARYKQSFEYMFVLSKGKPATYNEIADKPVRYPNKKHAATSHRKEDGEMRRYRTFESKGDYQARGNIWAYNTGYMHSTKDLYAYDHDAIFPEALARDHIISWSNPGDIILDPFSGSGTTAKMAYLLDRNFLGFDISHEYVTLAQKRVRGAMNQPKLPLDIWGSKNEMVLPSVQRSLFCNDVG